MTPPLSASTQRRAQQRRGAAAPDLRVLREALHRHSRLCAGSLLRHGSDGNSDIRMHFAEMYKAPVLEDWAAEVGVTVPDDLIKNTLDIDSVNESTYFFC